MATTVAVATAGAGEEAMEAKALPPANMAAKGKVAMVALLVLVVRLVVTTNKATACELNLLFPKSRLRNVVMTNRGETIVVMIEETTTRAVVMNTEVLVMAVAKVGTVVVLETMAVAMLPVVPVVMDETITSTVLREALAMEASRVATTTSLAAVMMAIANASIRVAADSQIGTAAKVSRTLAPSPVNNPPRTMLHLPATMARIALDNRVAVAAMEAVDMEVVEVQTLTTTKSWITQRTMTRASSPQHCRS